MQTFEGQIALLGLTWSCFGVICGPRGRNRDAVSELQPNSRRSSIGLVTEGRQAPFQGFFHVSHWLRSSTEAMRVELEAGNVQNKHTIFSVADFASCLHCLSKVSLLL